MTGQKLLHYQILEKLGEGGMGVVYKARDTHLDRFVAIKFLSSEKLADAGRRHRFAQEAKAASALNHPNIVTIYGIDEADGVDFISMELVAGKTLDQLIPRHGLRLDEALKYAVQIADALARAHSAGIIHRDLKPGNIMVDEHGLVKVLDFGLAKLTEPAPQAADEATRTLKPRTEEDTIVGTVAYMSPEQVEGKKLDGRSDIFSFGSVLYEMLTGQLAFRRDSRISTMAAILQEEPRPVREVVKGVPREVERIVKRCMRKDCARRLQCMDDVRGMLQDAEEDLESGGLDVASAARSKRPLRWVAAILATAIVTAGVSFVAFRRGPAGPLLRSVPFTTYLGWEADPSFSPEGTRVAFSWNGAKQDNWDIYVKLIGEGTPVALTTNPADDFSPAWSPDGRAIAFLRRREAGFELLSVPALGGAPETRLTELSPATSYRGYPNRELAWSADSAHLVYFDKPANEAAGLFLFSVATRERRRLTSCPATLMRDSDPAFSPDGRTLAFTRVFGYSFIQLYLLSLSPDLQPLGQPRRIARQFRAPAQPAWTPDGRQIVITTAEGLWRIPVFGSEVPERLPFAGDQLDVSRQGHRLIYNESTRNSNIWRLELRSEREIAPPASFIASTKADTNPQYSPDGKRVAFASDRSGNFEIWICNADASLPTQLTRLSAGESGSPRWFPDSRHIVFDSDKEGNFDIYVIDADGGPVQRLTSDPADDVTPAVSGDGKTIYFASRRSGSAEIWRMPSGGGEAVQVTRHGGFSPFESAAGDFLYYQRNEGPFSEVWRVPVHGGPETRVLQSVGDRRFAVLRDGIYFIQWPDLHSGASLQFYSFAGERTKKITKIEGSFLFYDIGLTVSPDARSVLYTRPVHPNSDLMLVENFH